MTNVDGRCVAPIQVVGPRAEGLAGYERVFDWAGGSLCWDKEAVMPWSVALALSEADPEDRAELAGLDEAADEDLLAAKEAKEMHRLRGLFLGQAAEAESAVLDLARRLYPRGDGSRVKRLTLGGALRTIRANLEAIPEPEDASLLWTRYGHLKWLHARRNQLIHAHLTVGLARQHESADLEPVISLLFEIQGGTSVDWLSAPTINGRAPRGADGDEVDEAVLQEDLWRAWMATCSAAALHSRLLAGDTPARRCRSVKSAPN